MVRLHPDKLNARTGVLPGTRGKVIGNTSFGSVAFERNLKVGSVGEDVRRLQELLNTEGFLVSESGAGSPGNESTYFGNRTKQALIKFQNFHRNEVLLPVNLTVGTGYFGPSTRDFVNGE